jgi:hypothetical protein
MVVWIAAAPRPDAPERFFVRLDCQNYPLDPPTGNFWDPSDNCPLPFASRPKGGGKAFSFRVDWEGGRAFYHPYDRVAAKSHPDWVQKHAHLVWDRNHTISDLLEQIYDILHCPDYTGV